MKKLIAILIAFALIAQISLFVFAVPENNISSSPDTSESEELDSSGMDSSEASPELPDESSDVIQEERPSLPENITLPEEPDIELSMEDSIAYQSVDGSEVVCLYGDLGNTSIAKVYKNNTLIQKSVCDYDTMTIYTEIYDLDPNTENQSGYDISESNGFLCVVLHCYTSEEVLSP